MAGRVRKMTAGVGGRTSARRPVGGASTRALAEVNSIDDVNLLLDMANASMERMIALVDASLKEGRVALTRIAEREKVIDAKIARNARLLEELTGSPSRA